MTRQIVLASGNEGKLREFSALFAQRQTEVLPQSAFGIGECAEPYGTFVENALAKARHAARHSGLPALADDSGICVPALGGAPGVLSARFAGDAPKSDTANNAKLSGLLAGVADRRCYYVCVLVLVRHEHDPQPLIAEGIWHGIWQDEPAGQGGFGYDPHFYLPDCGKTAAELSAQEKNAVSHRDQALRLLLQRWEQEAV